MERLQRYERFLKTDRCCCGCTDLRTGCIMWAWIDIVGGVLMMSGSIIQSYFDLDTILFSTMLGFLVSGCLLYGILHKGKSIYLLPAVISNIIILFCTPIYILVVAIFGTDQNEDSDHGRGFGRIQAIITLLFFGVLMWHKTAVTYTLYKKMRADENEPSPNEDVEYQTNAVF